ncbi:HD domain-containing protein [bacterium]|nr:HD domain-containing protein [bacterium]
MARRPAGAWLSASLLATAVTVTVVLLVLRGIPDPILVMILLAAVFVVLDSNSVEVGTRVQLSSSAMVVSTAAVIVGPGDAVVAGALMGIATILHPDLAVPSRWPTLAANVGQLTISAMAGAWVFSAFLPSGAIGAGDLGTIATGGLIAAVVYDSINYLMVAQYMARVYPSVRFPRWLTLSASHVALAILGLVGALLGAAYVMVGPLVMPLIVITYAVGHIAFAGQAQMRGAHESSVRGLVKAIEAMDGYTKGHTERVAHFVDMTGRRLGFDDRRLDRMRWTALIHDVGKMAVPPELLSRDGALTPEEQKTMWRHMAAVETVLAEVEFLKPMVEITRDRYRVLADGPAPGGVFPVEARILAAADQFDALTSARSYRSAVTQARAFDGLRSRADRLGSDVVEALIGVITESGETYGSPDEASTAAVEHLVRERAMRG